MRQGGYILLFLMLTASTGLLADEDLTYRYVDSTTYQLYQEKKWDSLVIVGNLAIENGIDYYYLRMRMGIAEYERQKYIRSSRHFERAVRFDSYSFTARSYLYSSLMLAGKRQQAYRSVSTLSKAKREQYGVSIKPVEHVLLVGGYSFNNNDAKNGSIQLVSPNMPFGRQLLMGNMSLASAGITVNFSHSFMVQINFTSEWVDKTDRFQYYLRRHTKIKRTIGQNGSYVNDFIETPVLEETNFDSRIDQSELYIHPSIQLDHGLSFGFYSNLLFIRLRQYTGNLVPAIRIDTAGYNAFTGEYTTIGLNESVFLSSHSDTSFTNFLLGAYVFKDYGPVSLNISGAYARLYDLDQIQADLAITYFPFGSVKFYGTTGLGLYHAAGTVDPSRLLFSQVLGAALSGSIWLEGEFRTGNLNNTSIRNGLVVFNLPDDINYLAGLKLSFFAGKHISLFIRYDYLHKTGGYVNRNMAGEVSEQVITFDYQTQNIIGGLQWTF